MSLRNLILSASAAGSVILPTADSPLYSDVLKNTIWGNSPVRSIAYNGSIYVVGGDNGRLATSTDGVTWIFQASLRDIPEFTTRTISLIVWTGTKFMVFTSDYYSATSVDGVSWQSHAALRSHASNTLIHGDIGILTAARAFDGVVIIARNASRISTYSDSTDTWTSRHPTTNYSNQPNFSDIIKVGTRYVAGGNNGGYNAILDSGDSVTWQISGDWLTLYRGINQLSNSRITTDGSTVINIDRDGRYGIKGFFSNGYLNGQYWTPMSSFPSNLGGAFSSNTIVRAVYINGMFRLYYQDGSIAVSPNGNSWSASSNIRTKGWPLTETVTRVEVIGSYCLIGGNNGSVMLSV